jgi:cell division septation protein DedD
VSDITHDVVDDGFHEIHLSGKQLVFLFMATMVVSVVIFLMGVFVGRNVRAQQAADHLADPTVALAASAPAPSPAASAPATADAGPQAAEPPSPPAESDELSYKKRLEGEALAEHLKPAASRDQPPPARPAPPAPVTAPPPAASATATAPAAAAATSGSVGTPQPGTWVIQVHALRDRTAAAGIVRRLVSKGYPAFLVAAGPPTGTYKVQIGRYKDRDEATKVIDRLKKEEQFNPWITR